MFHKYQPVRSILVLVALVALFATASLPEAHALVSPQAAASNFNSSFNGDHSGWSVVSGPWKDTSTAFTTVGAAGKVSSIKHAGNYTNFVYTVRMKRKSSDLVQLNWLYIRGNPLPLNPVNLWDEGYFFAYTESGVVLLAKCLGGACAVIAAGPTPAVVMGPNYNVLKVFAYGPWILFYMNGTLIFPLLDFAPILEGSVGVAMLRNSTSTGNKLYVDSAKLTRITADPGPMPNLKWITVGNLPYQDGSSLFDLRAP